MWGEGKGGSINSYKSLNIFFPEEQQYDNSHRDIKCKLWWPDLEIQAFSGIAGGEVYYLVEGNLALSFKLQTDTLWSGNLFLGTSLTDTPIHVEMTKQQVYLLQHCI